MSDYVLYGIASDIAAAGTDLSVKHHLSEDDIEALQNYAHERLVDDDPDDYHRIDERLAGLVAQMLLDALSAQHECEVIGPMNIDKLRRRNCRRRSRGIQRRRSPT